MITRSQITLIHIAKQQLGITPDQYAEMLHSFGVISSKNLNSDQAKKLINHLITLGFKISIPPSRVADPDPIGEGGQGAASRSRGGVSPRRPRDPNAPATTKQRNLILAIWQQHPH